MLKVGNYYSPSGLFETIKKDLVMTLMEQNVAKTDDVEQKIIRIAAEALKIDESRITPESNFVDDLSADSLDQVELMMAIEAAFDCDIPDDEASKIATIADAANYVRQKIAS